MFGLLRPGQEISRDKLLNDLVDIQFERNDIDFQRGKFRVTLFKTIGVWGKFKSITLPLITPIIFYDVITSTIGSFQIFQEAYVMTKNGTFRESVRKHTKRRLDIQSHDFPMACHRIFPYRNFF